jgi:hypothetical protein
LYDFDHAPAFTALMSSAIVIAKSDFAELRRGNFDSPQYAAMTKANANNTAAHFGQCSAAPVIPPAAANGTTIAAFQSDKPPSEKYRRQFS